MRKYESLFIFHPELKEERLQQKIEEVDKFITRSKGKPVNIKKMGREKLPYPIKKCSEGFYVVFDFEIKPEEVDKFKKNFLKDGEVLRYSVIRK
ncbi:MAG TPA: 30S ribosomal protein S6 [Candidatus Omnitrophica bacterium]|nr:30S ribosomal protein S6 [Candidatus Omnitrophota bacterium]